MSELVEACDRGNRVQSLGPLVELWPLAVIGAGLLASICWTAGLTYGAYLLASWAFG